MHTGRVAYNTYCPEHTRRVTYRQCIQAELRSYRAYKKSDVQTAHAGRVTYRQCIRAKRQTVLTGRVAYKQSTQEEWRTDSAYWPCDVHTEQTRSVTYRQCIQAEWRTDRAYTDRVTWKSAYRAQAEWRYKGYTDNSILFYSNKLTIMEIFYHWKIAQTGPFLLAPIAHHIWELYRSTEWRCASGRYLIIHDPLPRFLSSPT